MKYTIEESLEGIGLPQEQMKRLKLKDGDTVFLIETEHGFEITTADPEFIKQMKIADICMDKYYNALAELAKGPSEQD